MDYIEKGNLTELPIPKYNNKVQNPSMPDKNSHVTVPIANLKKKSMKGEKKILEFCTNNGEDLREILAI